MLGGINAPILADSVNVSVNYVGKAMLGIAFLVLLDFVRSFCQEYGAARVARIWPKNGTRTAEELVQRQRRSLPVLERVRFAFESFPLFFGTADRALLCRTAICALMYRC